MQLRSVCHRSISLLASIAAASAMTILTGCGVSSTDISTGSAVAGKAIKGRVYGGQSPIANAAIYLYAASTSGYATAATSLLKPGSAGVNTDAHGLGYVPTDSNGAFTITSDYDCGSATTQIYMVGVGGNPGLTGTVNNTGISELLALGSCGQYSANSFLYINELSTVAATSALSQFMTPGTVNIATSPTNIVGMANAFVTAANLVSPFSSTANTVTPSGLGVVSYQQINTVGDILSACVNSSAPTSTGCSTLFTGATTPSGSVPADTLQAMLNIARYPANNVGTLYGLVGATPPFQPTLPVQYNGFTGRYDGQPSDWTLSIVYGTAPLEGYVFPNLDDLVIDSQANVWANGNGHAYKISNAGALLYNVIAPISTGVAYESMAVDLNDGLWIDDGSYSVTNISANGTVNCYPGTNPYCYIPGIGSNYASIIGGQNILNGVGGIAIDPSNQLWVGTGGALTEINQSGIGLQDYIGNGVAKPLSVAIDPVGNFWMVNSDGGYGASGNTISVVKPSGAPVAVYSGGGMNYPNSIAFDHAGNAWIGNQNGNSLTEFSPSGVPSVNSPISGGGLKFVSGVAVDGLGNVWVSSLNTVGLGEFNSSGVALSPSTGFYGGGGDELGSVAIDSSGNVWGTTYNSATINEIVGVGGPTVNPIALARKNGTVGTRP
jgi:hypothetical protein